MGSAVKAASPHRDIRGSNRGIKRHNRLVVGRSRSGQRAAGRAISRPGNLALGMTLLTVPNFGDIRDKRHPLACPFNLQHVVTDCKN